MEQRSRFIHLKEYELSEFFSVSMEEFDKIKEYNKKYYDIEESFEDENHQRFVQLRTRSFIGLIKISSDLSLMIGPKIDNTQFIEMMRYVEPEKIKIWQEFIDGIKPDSNFIDLFIGVFLRETYSILTKNQKKDYELKTELLQTPRGRINIRQSLQKSKSFTSSSVYQYFEFNNNTEHNQIIKYTMIRIKKLISPENRSKYQQILQILDKTEYKSWNSNEIKRISYNRFNLYYKPIHNFCKLILDDFSIIFETGTNNFFGFLLNTWNIFERFIFRIFDLFQHEFEVHSHVYTELKDNSEDYPENEYPDVLLSKNEQILLVIDAKYKDIQTKADENQVLRYMGLFNISIGVIILPDQKDSPSKSEIISLNLFDRDVKIIIEYLSLTHIQERSTLEKFVKDTLENTEFSHTLDVDK